MHFFAHLFSCLVVVVHNYLQSLSQIDVILVTFRRLPLFRGQGLRVVLQTSSQECSLGRGGAIVCILQIHKINRLFFVKWTGLFNKQQYITLREESKALTLSQSLFRASCHQDCEWRFQPRLRSRVSLQCQLHGLLIACAKGKNAQTGQASKYLPFLLLSVVGFSPFLLVCLLLKERTFFNDFITPTSLYFVSYQYSTLGHS